MTVIDFQKGMLKKMLERYRQNVQFQIDTGHDMYDILPERILAKFTEKDFAENEGYIKGLKVALQILERTIDMSDESDWLYDEDNGNDD